MAGKVITFRLAADVVDRVDAAAGSDRSAWLRDLIERALLSGTGSGPAKVVPLAAAKKIRCSGVPDTPSGSGADVRSLDRGALLDLVRSERLSPRDAERKLSLPGLRYRNAECALMDSGELWVTDGFLETFDVDHH